MCGLTYVCLIVRTYLVSVLPFQNKQQCTYMFFRSCHTAYILCHFASCVFFFCRVIVFMMPLLVDRNLGSFREGYEASWQDKSLHPTLFARQTYTSIEKPQRFDPPSPHPRGRPPPPSLTKLSSPVLVLLILQHVPSMFFPLPKFLRCNLIDLTGRASLKGTSEACLPCTRTRARCRSW